MTSRSAMMTTVVMPKYEPDDLLTRDRAAEAATEAGFPTSPATLATKACRGGGPIFRKFGPRVLYRYADLIAWAESKTSAPRRSTSEPLHFNVAV